MVSAGVDELDFIVAQLRAATSPALLFGNLEWTKPDDQEKARKIYRHLAMTIHPDRHKNHPSATEAFAILQRLYTVLQAGPDAVKAAAAAAAAATAPVLLKTARREYTLGKQFAQGDLAALYECTIVQSGKETSGVLKIARDAADNDLLEMEARNLRTLATPPTKTWGKGRGKDVPGYIPRLVESFLHKDSSGVSRRVNVFPSVETEKGPIPTDAFYTAEEVRAEYKDGLDPRQMAWMWRRLLIALAYSHEHNIIHGSVLPSHILIQPESHGLLLVDWTHSVADPKRSRKTIPYLSPAYESWYPALVLSKKEPTPAVDILMAARCMVYVLGGDPLTGSCPSSVPTQIAHHLQFFIVRGATAGRGTRVELSAPRSPWDAYDEFHEIITTVWGRRTFVPFSMPTRA